VLITGHTGFVGTWLVFFLKELGATVIGYSRDIPTQPSLFEITGLRSSVETIEADVLDYNTLFSTIKKHKPEIVFHLAAQSLVLDSYKFPVETYTTNIVGTLNLLETIRQLKKGIALVNMTSDKCYENVSTQVNYKEKDSLGGRDPYSSSKACSELITRAYRDSYFPADGTIKHGISVCSVRAGNIIGGGDWSNYRLIPDIIRAFQKGKTLRIRYPNAIRPWQHVFDVINALLLLAEKLSGNKGEFSEAWNIGPNSERTWRVEEIVKFFANCWEGHTKWKTEEREKLKEEIQLSLETLKAKERIGWEPIWDTINIFEETVNWYKYYFNYPDKIVSYTRDQVKSFLERISSS
tara:strand:+ start:1162 stop:2214 length:1053 start_codon:yes stop_codon:yes gene_type:complete